MTGRGNKVSDWKRRLKSQLQRDKKKTALLIVLLVTVGVVGGRLVVSQALPTPAKAGAAAGDGGDRLLPDLCVTGPFAPSYPKALGAPRPDAAARREEYLASLDRTIARDLFRPNPELFPPSGDDQGAGGANADKAQDDQPGWFQQVWDWVEQARQARRDEIAQAEAVRAQAGALVLQSTMVGPSATALINGQVLRKSDWIDGFRVKSIASDTCVVSKDGVDVVLRMKK